MRTPQFITLDTLDGSHRVALGRIKLRGRIKNTALDDRRLILFVAATIGVTVGVV